VAVSTFRPSGDFRASYRADTRIFDTAASLWACVAAVAVLCLAPLVLDKYQLSLLIQIGYLGIAALGLNILVGFTGQISIGHAAFFGFGAFASAWISNNTPIPVFFAIPLAGVATTAIGMLFGVPAARLKGLYLAIATLAAQYILQDFFARAQWFTGGVAGTPAAPFTIFGVAFDRDETYFYVVLAYLVACYVAVANLMRTRDGRALVAVRDHYLSAEMMGINLTKYRTLSFGISSFFAGIGGALYAHYLGFVSVEGFTILFSIQFLGMIIIGGLGSLMGTLMGTAFMTLLPEMMDAGTRALAGSALDEALNLKGNVSYLREIAIGLAIILFLIFEPDGLAHRWRQIKAYWKLYPFSY
jgi:branched-chain amino acid transport system permease protein